MVLLTIAQAPVRSLKASETPESEIWSWVPWDMEPRIVVLARAKQSSRQSDACSTTQTVSRLLPTTMADVQFQNRFCGICGGQTTTGAGYLVELRFSLPILTLQNTPHTLIILSSTAYSPGTDSIVSDQHTKQ
jgi:hypothetical protein